MRLSLRRPYAVAAAVMVALVLVVLLAFVLIDGGGDGGEDSGGDSGGKVSGAGIDGHADTRPGTGAFRIAGDAVRPISPGRFAPIDVVFTNPHPDTLRITRLRVRVRSVRAPNVDVRHACSRRDFAVSQVGPGFTVSVPPRVTRSLSSLRVPQRSWPRVRLVNRPVNQDGCKGASITLAYVGSGTLGR